MHPGLKESDIKKTITDWLTVHRLFWWPGNVGSFRADYKGKKRFIQFGRKGEPDLFVVRRAEIVDYGKFGDTPRCKWETEIIGIEVKRQDGEQSQMQREFEVEFTKAGGRYCLARSLEDVVRFLT